MNIERISMEAMWAENADGTSVVPLDYATGDLPPKETHPYLFVRNVRELRTEIFDRNSGGTSMERLTVGCKTWSEDLVLALATGANGQEKYRLTHAIIIAAEACERCMNALAHRYGLPWGYDECDPEYLNNRTRCKMCKVEGEERPMPLPEQVQVYSRSPSAVWYLPEDDQLGNHIITQGQLEPEPDRMMAPPTTPHGNA